MGGEGNGGGGEREVVLNHGARDGSRYCRN